MWSIRILKGPQAGKSIPLREGENKAGRASHCYICIPAPGISKEHASFILQNGQLFVKDLNSTNGIYVNGVRVNTIQLKRGDKIALFDCILDVQPTSSGQTLSIPQYSQGSAALNLQTNSLPSPPPTLNIVRENSQVHQQTVSQNKVQSLLDYIQHYMNNVVLPGIYKLGEAMEFKWALGLFVSLFIILVTTLSVIPMISITKNSIQQESLRRVENLAEVLKGRYIDAVRSGTESTFDTRFIEKEPGVEGAYVVSSENGKILAPARRAGESVNKPFLHEARKSDEKISKILDDSHIGISIPITSISRETAQPVVTAHSIVLYNMGSIAVDTERMISLFIQVFTIAFFLGLIIYYFMQNFIDFPIKSLGSQLNKVLKNEIDTVSVSYNYPSLQILINHLNSLIHRSKNPQNHTAPVSLIDKSAEAKELITIISYPALILDKNVNIIGSNTKFEELTGLRLDQIEGQSVEALNDQALILSLKDLIERSRINPHGLINQLEFSGNSYDINLKTLHGENEINFYLIVLIPGSDGGFHVG